MITGLSQDYPYTKTRNSQTSLSITDNIGSLEEQEVLIIELTFLVATSVVQNLEQIKKSMIDIYIQNICNITIVMQLTGRHYM